MSSLLLALPSKGRLHEQMNKFFDSAGLKLSRSGGKRTYSGIFKQQQKKTCWAIHMDIGLQSESKQKP